MNTGSQLDTVVSKKSRDKSTKTRRASGTHWLGSVPSEWPQKRLKYAVHLINNKSNAGDIDLPYIGMENIETSTGRHIPGVLEDSADGLSNMFCPNDVLFGKLRPYLAKVLHAKEPGLCSSELLVLRPKDVSARFLLYYCLSREFIRVVDSSTYGSKMPRASWQFIGNLPILVPSPEEQKEIADFLDQETSKIDELIQKNVRLISLLHKKREARITSAVTANGDRPRGVPIKRFLTFTTSGSRGWAEFYSDEGDLFIQSGNLNRRLGLDLSSVQRIVPPEGAEARRTMIRRDDILVCITGAYTGNVAVVDFDPPRAFINQHIALLRVDSRRAFPRFLAYLLASSFGQGHFKASQYGGTKQGLGFDDILSVAVSLPQLREQERIVRELDSEIALIEQTTSKIVDCIGKLRQYRSAIVSDAVTGQIDVRNYKKEAICP